MEAIRIANSSARGRERQNTKIFRHLVPPLSPFPPVNLNRRFQVHPVCKKMGAGCKSGPDVLGL